MADTCPFLGPLVPLFWISGDVSSGFQSQSGFCLIRYFCGGECNVHSPRFTSGATLADLLAAGVQPVTSPHACAEVGLGSDSNVLQHEQKTNALPLCQRPGLNLKLYYSPPDELKNCYTLGEKPLYPNYIPKVSYTPSPCGQKERIQYLGRVKHYCWHRGHFPIHILSQYRTLEHIRQNCRNIGLSSTYCKTVAISGS